MPTRLVFENTSVFALVVLVLMASLIGCNFSKDKLTPKQEIAAKLQQARNLLQRGETDAAMMPLQEILASAPDNRVAIELAMDTQLAAKRFDKAAEFARQLAVHDPANAISLFTRAFDWHLRIGDYQAAEEDLNRAVASEPSNAQPHRLLAQLLNAQGRRFEASEHIRELIRLKAIQHNELLSLVDLRGPFNLVNYGGLIDQEKPSLFAMGNARLKYIGERTTTEETIEMLKPVVDRHPGNQAASAFYGLVLADIPDQSAFDQWLANVPDAIDKQPEYWGALGIRLSRTSQHEQAVRAFAEAIRRDPTDRESIRGLIAALESLGKDEQTRTLRDRLAKLDKIFRIAKDADHEQSLWISLTLQELQRPWESLGWLIHAKQIKNQLQQSVAQIDQRHQQILAWEKSAQRDQVLAARLNNLMGFDASEWPLPDFSVPTALDPEAMADTTVPLNLQDVARSVGIDTRYQSGFPFNGEADLLPYHINGGGIAVLDYDLDGATDVYIAQAGGKPNDLIGSTANQLYRQQDDRFVETTKWSDSGDRGYAQGVCAGDVNQDGFADLLVGNIGENTIYINQGDGTFRLANELISEKTSVWTSCYAVGDLDGDHLPEIVEVNYIDDEKSYLHKCDPNCPSPQSFAAGQDVFYRCQGDGTYQVWQAVKTEIPRLGFGVVIANFDRRDGNDCFIANDGDLNHYWTSVLNKDSKQLELVESGTVNGCSIGRGGNSQACMGVASGDFNRDGTLDLHVTNYYREPVNFFLQTDAGFFSDKARKYQLHEPTMETLGFGTQAVDFDHDGWMDLAVLNGHVDNTKDKDGTPFQMMPQLFRGSPTKFALQKAKSDQPYWSTPQLGRTLATLDFNRDGRMDLIASHLDLPIALLENRTEAGSWLQIELVGTTSERDATGAVVTVTIADESLTAWQTGGDGYMCTNESVVHFGVAAAEMVDRVDIRWPSGREQTFTDVEVEKRYLAVENDDKLARRW